MTKSAFSGTARLVVDLGTAQIKPLVSGGHRAKARQRRQTGAAGQEGSRAPWCPDEFRQTAARIVRRTTPSECGEGERRRVVSRRRHVADARCNRILKDSPEAQ